MYSPLLFVDSLDARVASNHSLGRSPTSKLALANAMAFAALGARIPLCFEYLMRASKHSLLKNLSFFAEASLEAGAVCEYLNDCKES